MKLRRYQSKAKGESGEVVVGVPETSSPGESQSNGAAERAVRSIEDQLRTMKLALESHINAKIPCQHPIIAWMILYASHLLTKELVGEDGLTGYERLHGQRAEDRVPEFGEVIYFYVPKRCRAKLDPVWRVGVFLGTSWNSYQNFIGLPSGRLHVPAGWLGCFPASDGPENGSRE